MQTSVGRGNNEMITNVFIGILMMGMFSFCCGIFVGTLYTRYAQIDDMQNSWRDK